MSVLWCLCAWNTLEEFPLFWTCLKSILLTLHFYLTALRHTGTYISVEIWNRDFEDVIVETGNPYWLEAQLIQIHDTNEVLSFCNEEYIALVFSSEESLAVFELPHHFLVVDKSLLVYVYYSQFSWLAKHQSSRDFLVLLPYHLIEVYLLWEFLEFSDSLNFLVFRFFWIYYRLAEESQDCTPVHQ